MPEGRLLMSWLCIPAHGQARPFSAAYGQIMSRLQRIATAQRRRRFTGGWSNPPRSCRSP